MGVTACESIRFLIISYYLSAATTSVMDNPSNRCEDIHINQRKALALLQVNTACPHRGQGLGMDNPTALDRGKVQREMHDEA